MRRWEKWIPLALAGIGLVAYSNSFTGPFIFDDRVMITENQSIAALLPLSWRLRGIVQLSFRLNYAFGGFSVAHYHATNLVIHLLSGLALFGAVCRLLLKPALGGRYGAAAPWLAAATAGLWLVHPLQTESVTYICQRHESLMGLLYLAAFYCLVRARDSARPAFWYLACAASFMVGVGTKESIFTFPVLAIVYDHVFEEGAGGRWAKRHWVRTCALVLLCVVPAISMIRLVLVPFIVQGGERGVSPLLYLVSQFGVVGHYLRLSFVPHPLCLDYAWPPLRVPCDAILPGVFLGLLAAGTVWLILRRDPAGFAGAWFFITLAPTSSLIPIDDLAFEHRMYLPLAAVTALPVMLLWEVVRRTHRRGDRTCAKGEAACAVVIAAALVVLTGITVRRNRDYRSELAIWEQTVAVRPDNLRARVALGAALLAEGRAGDAEDVLRRTLTDLPDAQAGVGYSVDYVRGKALNGLGTISELKGDLAAAEACFREAVTIDPEFTTARNNLGIVLEKRGDSAGARAEWRETLRRRPGDDKARFCLAAGFLREYDYVRAKSEFGSMSMTGPQSVEWRMAFAWLLATCPEAAVRDGERAVELLRGLTGEDPVSRVRSHDIRGAGYAAAGMFEEAAAEARKALQAASEVRMGGVEGIEERLALYLVRRPFVETRQPRD